MVRALVCQPSDPCSIPSMSCSETVIKRGNLILLLPPTTLCVLHAIFSVKQFPIISYPAISFNVLWHFMFTCLPSQSQALTIVKWQDSDRNDGSIQKNSAEEENNLESTMLNVFSTPYAINILFYESPIQSVNILAQVFFI